MKLQNLVILFIFIILSACSDVTYSAGKVLDNAGSVVRSGSGKLFTTPQKSSKSALNSSDKSDLEKEEREQSTRYY